MKTPKRILMVNFGGIGDEILFLPAISSLKKEFPQAKITLALEPRSKSVKDLSNLIDDVMCVDISSLVEKILDIPCLRCCDRSSEKLLVY